MQDQSLATKLADYQKRGVSRIKLGLTDIDGVIRGKYLSLDKFKALLADGGGFCDCVFGWDADDQLYDGDDRAITGWHTGFPDASYRLIAASQRRLPDAGTPYFIAEFAGASLRHGLVAFLGLLALLSLSLGILNLLPVPLLDGGHLLYLLVEFLTRRPVPERVERVGQRIGIVMLAALLGLALYNDLLRLLG